MLQRRMMPLPHNLFPLPHRPRLSQLSSGFPSTGFESVPCDSHVRDIWQEAVEVGAASAGPPEQRG